MPATLDRLQQRLRSVLGDDAVTDASAVLAAHAADGMMPRVVITPASTEQVGAALSLCAEARAAVIPWGGGTAMALGNPPRRADVVLRTMGLQRSIEHDAANLTISVQAGMSLAVLQSTLAREKQFAALDPPLPVSATVGGTIAANLNGPRRSSYGSVRDLVIGAKMILASGEQIKAGGKVVKNVAGYDLCKLLVGSLGTLGIITEVTLRVAPLPETAAVFVADGTLPQMQQFAGELARSPLLPATVLLLGENRSARWRMAVVCEGFASSVQRHLRDLKALGERTGIEVPATEQPGGVLWQTLRDFPLQRGRLIYRVTIPPAVLFEFIEQLEVGTAEEISADVSMGTVWLASDESALARFPQIAALARERQGHAILFTAPPAFKRGINVWGSSPATLPLMRAIKREFDPDDLLNPGRFIGDL